MRPIIAVWKNADPRIINGNLFCIGIVLMENETFEISCRIAVACYGDSVKDTKHIMEYGSKLNMDQAIAFFPEKKELITAKWKKN